MTVEVDKAMRIHEAEIFRFVVGRTSRSERFRDEIVDFLTAVTTKRDQDLDSLGGVADRFGSELPELGMSRKHDRDGFADDNHRCGAVGELRIMGEA